MAKVFDVYHAAEPVPQEVPELPDKLGVRVVQWIQLRDIRHAE